MHRNFNVGFTSHKNDIHVHLSQWQYWWWFWFAAVWSLYFFVILRIILFGNEKYKPVVNTSLRSHGKWGDFLVALIPLSWCGNILINSNFILRMIEWQNESSLFVVRIQGKQWYWSYKFNSDTNFRLQNVYINVGNNNWYKTANVGQLGFNMHTSTLIFIYEYEFKKLHTLILEKKKKYAEALLTDFYAVSTETWNYHQKKIFKKLRFFKKFYMYGVMDSLSLENSIESFFKLNKNHHFIERKIKSSRNFKLNIMLRQDTLPVKYPSNTNFFKEKKKTLFTNNKNYNSFYENHRLEEVEESMENLRLKVNNFPIKLIKGTLNKHNITNLTLNSNLNKNILFSYRINNSNITQKISQVEQFWGFRQKKYKKLRSFFFKENNRFHSKTYSAISNFSFQEDYSKYNFYNGIKNNKNKTEVIPATLARRLLRTKRTLVLPAHINITLITSSYDVVHSWFVPGLGLKIDCVPGRSTHHTLYIDNIGFYYGQCAEICGRYHHHMPIRVCALNYEHFLLWWQTKGLPRMYRSKTFTSNKSLLLNKFKN